MIRLLGSFALCLSVTISVDRASAEPEITPDSRTSRALAINAAMHEARDHLAQNRPKDAVASLEKQIIYINGNPTFLALLREAYVAYLKQGSTDRLEHVKRQLKTLDPKLNVDDLVAKTKTLPADEVAFRAGPAASSEESPTDPFQQTPLDRQVTQVSQASRESCDKARAAFELHQYAEAATLFAQAVDAGVQLNADERTAWGYCRLHALSARLNKPGTAGPNSAELEREAHEAMQLGGETLQKFGRDVLAGIRKRPSSGAKPVASVLPEGWQGFESENFRIIFREGKEQAVQLAERAEELRTLTFKKWSGSAGAEWPARCDIHLHPSADGYAQATHQSAESPGHSSVGVANGAVSTRRIDLHSDDAGFIEVTLPHEIAYVVLSDLFAEQPLPRWADIGMTALAQPSPQVSRYVRAVPKLAQDRKLFKIADLLKMMDYPDPAHITPFYVESVSLVEYLVKLKGPLAFALYLREAPRRGYEEALERHYGFRNATELQERWLKYVQGIE